MVPLAWYRLIKQAGYPDLVAFCLYCPRGAPLPGGGEQGDRRRRGAGPPVASPPAPARLGLQGIFSLLEGAGECIRELVGVGVFGVYECGGYDRIGGGANGPLPMPHTCFLDCYGGTLTVLVRS